MLNGQSKRILSLLLLFHTVLQCIARSADMELDLDKGKILGRNPYIKLLNTPKTGRTIPCSAQAVIRLDFSGPLKRARFELFYGQEPELWTFLLSDSPKAYGFGGNHKYTSNCASVQVFNRQLRVYSNVLSNYRAESIDGHTLMEVEDEIVGNNSTLTVDVRDEFVKWETKRNNVKDRFIEDIERINQDRSRRRSPFLFTLSDQKTEYGPNENYLYAAFNRVPLGRFHNGSGLCRVRITFKRKQENGVCAKRHCHQDAVCKQIQKSFKCICRPGYIGDGQTSCQDFDECTVNNGGCQQICHNLQGSYYCGCNIEYTLMPNGRSCTGKRKDNGLIRKKIKLKFNVGQCNIRSLEKELFIKALKRKLLRQEICSYPCTINDVTVLRCRARKKKDGSSMLHVNFELKVDDSKISPSKYCNYSCLRCQIEKKLQKFIADLRSLANHERFNVSLRGQVFAMNGKSLKVPRVRNACTQGMRRKIKRGLAGCMPGMYYDIFLQRCANCSRGTYQPNGSETFCFRCPGNKTTLYSGSTGAHQCQDTVCGGNLTAMSGVIMSPNFPDAYPRDVDCSWTIFPSKNRHILLLIPNISLHATSDCSDFLTMREGESPYSVATYYACESFDQPVAFVSRSKNLYVKFRSRAPMINGMAEGFKIFYVTFEKQYRYLVRNIVESGEMYANESNRRLLQDEKLVHEVLDVIVEPQRLQQMLPNYERNNKVPKSFRDFIERKVVDFLDYSPYRKRRSLEDAEE